MIPAFAVVSALVLFAVSARVGWNVGKRRRHSTCYLLMRPTRRPKPRRIRRPFRQRTPETRDEHRGNGHCNFRNSRAPARTQAAAAAVSRRLAFPVGRKERCETRRKPALRRDYRTTIGS